MANKREPTIEDLYHIEGKAEIVNGELVLMPMTSGLHGFAVLEVAASLRVYGRRLKSGYAFADSTGYVVNLPNRRSFAPDASFWNGDKLTSKFIDGAPVFAVEVRSEEEYGPAAERAMAAKRADYFAAGTLVVWDVDVLRDHVVRVYRATDPMQPTTYRRGQLAGAEPALPGWAMPVDDLFPSA